MTDLAIRVENLSKLYPAHPLRAGHIGAPSGRQQRHDTLRDALTSRFRRPKLSLIMARKATGTMQDDQEERTMAETNSIAEAIAAYGTAVADLQQPLILQQQGQPLAVMVSFEEYQHWRALAADEAQRRLAGWRALDELLGEVHRRPSDYSAEQIEMEIGAARAELRKAHNDRRPSH